MTTEHNDGMSTILGLACMHAQRQHVVCGMAHTYAVVDEACGPQAGLRSRPPRVSASMESGCEVLSLGGRLCGAQVPSCICAVLRCMTMVCQPGCQPWTWGRMGERIMYIVVEQEAGTEGVTTRRPRSRCSLFPAAV